MKGSSRYDWCIHVRVMSRRASTVTCHGRVGTRTTTAAAGCCHLLLLFAGLAMLRFHTRLQKPGYDGSDWHTRRTLCIMNTSLACPTPDAACHAHALEHLLHKAA